MAIKVNLTVRWPLLDSEFNWPSVRFSRFFLPMVIPVLNLTLYPCNEFVQST
jgi:hypothetical protein